MMPHVVSANFTPPLAPATDLAAKLSGKTLTFEAPVVQNGAITRTEKATIYLAASGTSYSPSWSGTPWQITENTLCIGVGSGENCRNAFYDASGQMVLADRRQIMLGVTEIAPGDAHHVRAQYAQAQRNRAIAAGVLLAFIGGAIASSGSGGGGSGSRDDPSRYYRSSGSSGGGSSGGSYTAPIGGESGLYGSCHGVGC